jgi:hypothetical protein
MGRFLRSVVAKSVSVLIEIGGRLPALWYVVAALVIAWACVYLWIQFERQPLTLLWFVVGFGVAMWLMFFGEGTEIAYTNLHDKDPEQVPPDLQASFAKLVDSEQVLFISGRQLLVVFAIVGMTLLCELVSDVGAGAKVRWPSDEGVATLAYYRHAFSLLFPAFFAFWFAQLPSKMISHESALMAYRWPPMRWAIGWSMLIGESLRIEGPSSHLKELVARKLRRGDEDVLKPSRAFYYKTSAMLRDGKGLEDTHIRMWLGSAGAIDVEEAIKIHAYGRGVRKVAEKSLCEAAFKPGASLKVSSPVKASQNGPDATGPITVEGATLYQLAWDVQLTQDLPVGKELEVQVSYANEDGAMKHTVSEEDVDSYDYTVRFVPTKRLTFDIMVRPNAGFMLTNQTVTATTSENSDINWQEAKRVKCSNVDDESDSFGFRYAVEYPLLNTKFSFGWSIGRAAKELDPTDLSRTALPPAPSKM